MVTLPATSIKTYPTHAWAIEFQRFLLQETSLQPPESAWWNITPLGWRADGNFRGPERSILGYFLPNQTRWGPASSKTSTPLKVDFIMAASGRRR